MIGRGAHFSSGYANATPASVGSIATLRPASSPSVVASMRYFDRSVARVPSNASCAMLGTTAVTASLARDRAFATTLT